MFIPLDHTTPQIDHDTLRYLAAMVTHEQARAVEVGSWVGSTALTLAPFFERVYCIDTFLGSDTLKPIADKTNAECAGVFRVFCHNMGAELLNKTFPCVGLSADWASVWPFPVDLIFIDANHEYEQVKSDIKAWMPHCRGIVCGHDYGQMFPGVKAAVDELLGDRVQVRGNTWWLEASA